MERKGISAEAIAKLQPVILLKGSNEEKLQTIKTVLASSEIGLKGVAEVEEILEFVNLLGVKTEVELDLTLARGLNYYTGAIFEVKAKDVQIGSITGGGRYDNLTGVFGVDGLSGVGISFGADRIYDVLNQLELYPSDLMQATKVLFAVFGSEELKFAIECAKEMRAAGIPVEVYPEPVKMKKQMSYADAKNIPFVAIIGETEMAEKKVMLKNMESGNQTLCSVQEVIQMVK
ncbi:MAG: ATP phosphoribosyltransferase regulatory subunit [Paludibacteraceae bacterium]|nr:ATP phosphoribosyltransferase regulatory subunit [Paludibacteraceae bacterium]